MTRKVFNKKGNDGSGQINTTYRDLPNMIDPDALERNGVFLL